MPNIARPFLMFQGQAEAAMQFYATVLPDTRVVDLVRYNPGEPGLEGSVKKGTLSVAGLAVQCTDSAVKHAFTFTPAMSIFIECAEEDDLRRSAAALADGGVVLMPVATYGFSRLFAWVQDRFGVSWQLTLP